VTDHEEWDELAAGHALGALEPDDQQRFEAHLETCTDCRQVLAETEAVMAELAYAAEQVGPPPELKARLMASIHDASDGPSMGVVSSPDTLEIIRARRADRGSRGRHTRETVTANWVRFAAAASVVLLAIIAAGVWSLSGSNGTTSPRFVALASTATHSDVATVEVLGDQTWVIPSAMTANDTSSSQYVLWVVPDKGNPVAVGGFDVQSGRPVVAVGQVSRSLSSVKAFAVSKEPGRTVPKAPTVIVASGALT
jgi:anti-sigma-K factor RskA